MRFWIEFAFLRLGAWVFGCLPVAAIPRLARFLGPIASWTLYKRKQLAAKNLKRAFPDWPPSQARAAAAAFWVNIIQTVLECLSSTRRSSYWVHENVVLENEEVLKEALTQKRGVLLHTGHFGNWELDGMALAAKGYPLAGVGRKQKNPYADAWLMRWRSLYGRVMFNHHQVAREARQWLKSNGCLAIFSDHNLYKGGVFVDFFGTPAATTTLTALFHLKYGSPIVGVYHYRKNGKLICRFEHLYTPLAGDREMQVRQLTEFLTKKIEDWVREDPANWLWGHNRWKRQPESEINSEQVIVSHGK